MTCTGPAKISVNDSSLSFPVLPEYDLWAHESSNGSLISESRAMRFQTNFSQIWEDLDYPNNGTDPRMLKPSWLPLTSDWGFVSAGLMLFDPAATTSKNDGTRLGMGCSVDARWAQGLSLITRNDLGGDFDESSAVSHQRPGTNFQEFSPVDDGSYKRINLSMEWLHALTPANQGDATSLEAIISASGLSHLDTSSPRAAAVCTVFLEHIISVVVANGISRVGLSRQTTRGYSLVADTFLDYLAVSVLCCHLLIALGHTVILLWTRRSSAAWDSLPESLALGQNSEPAPIALQNTCAGINCSKTYGEKARIVATSSSSSGGEADHQELVFIRYRFTTAKAAMEVGVGNFYGHRDG